MAYISEFIASRQDTTVPFFYDSTNEEHKKIMEIMYIKFIESYMLDKLPVARLNKNLIP
jgi:hypothetical protein